MILWEVIFSGSDLQPLTLVFLHSHLNINPPVQILFFFFSDIVFSSQLWMDNYKVWTETYIVKND